MDDTINNNINNTNNVALLVDIMCLSNIGVGSSLFKILNSQNNIQSYAILKDKNDMFKQLVSGKSFDEALNILSQALNKYGENDWLDEQHMSLRQLNPVRNAYSNYNFMPVMLQRQLSLLEQMHGKDSRFKRVLKVIKDRFRVGCIPYKVWVKAFKDFGTSLKKFFTTDEFKYYTDLELLVGYNLVGLSPEDKLVRVREWCFGEVDRGEFEALFYSQFDEISDNMLARTALTPYFMSFEEFINSVPLWMSDGSSRGKRLRYNDEGVQKVTKAKKPVIGLAYSTEELLGLCLGPSRLDFYSATEKMEPGRKGRLIISAPITQQIRMSYVEYCLNDLFKKMLPDVTILKNSKNQQKYFESIMRLTVKPGQSKIFFPADASAFDQNVSKREILTLLYNLRKLIFRLVNERRVHPDILIVIDLIIELFFDIPISIDGQVVGLWQHGMPSGIKWTALLDSWINCVRFKVVKKLNADSVFGPIVTLEEAFTGDDMSLIFARIIDALRVLMTYNLLNIEIHPNKNLLSLQFTEYLRKIYYDGKQYGYPNRMVTKFLFRLPENSGSPNNHSLIVERSYSLFRMFNRTDNVDKGLYYIHDMIKYVLNLDSVRAEKIMYSPNITGGLGLLSTKNFNWKKRDVECIIGWPKASQINDKGFPLSGVYSESVSEFSSRLGLGPVSSELRKSIYKAIDDSGDPYDARTNVTVECIEYRIKLNVNTKMIISAISGAGRWRSWRSQVTFNPPNLPDILLALKRKDDIRALRSITSDDSMLLLDDLLIKSDRRFFWAWVKGDLEQLSFIATGTNEIQRNNLCSYVLSTLVSRVLSSHNLMSFDLYNKCLFVAYRYISENYEYWLREKFVKYCTD